MGLSSFQECVLMLARDAASSALILTSAWRGTTSGCYATGRKPGGPGWPRACSTKWYVAVQGRERSASIASRTSSSSTATPASRIAGRKSGSQLALTAPRSGPRPAAPRRTPAASSGQQLLRRQVTALPIDCHAATVRSFLISPSRWRTKVSSSISRSPTSRADGGESAQKLIHAGQCEGDCSAVLPDHTLAEQRIGSRSALGGCRAGVIAMGPADLRQCALPGR